MTRSIQCSVHGRRERTDKNSSRDKREVENSSYSVGRPLRIGDVELAVSAKFIRHGEPDERSATDANKALYGQREPSNSPLAHRPTSR